MTPLSGSEVGRVRGLEGSRGARVNKGRSMRRGRVAVIGLAGLGAAAALALPASAQVGAGAASADALQQEARLRELQQLQLDNRLRANTNIPADQRVLFD